MEHARQGTRVAAVIVAGTLVAACANQRDAKQDHGNFGAQQQAEINDRLAQAATSIEEQLTALKNVEKARTKPADDPVDGKNLPKELKRTVNISWAGPARTLLENMAGNIGYNFQIRGDAPPTPKTVEVSAKDEMMVRVFEDIGAQLMPSATVVFDPNQKTVFLSYDNSQENTSMTRGG